MAYHIPVLSVESIDGLNIKPEGIYIDLTFGGGGHSRAILNKLGLKGRLLALDQDEDAATNIPDDPRITFIHSNFRYLRNFLEYYNIDKVDGVLADLGISSHQIDNAERGFTYMADTLLDMRMNSQSALTASAILNEYPEASLTQIFWEYGEIGNARALTKIILEIRQHKKILTTGDFVNGIQSFIPANNNYSILSRIFQALRIEVNDELGALRDMLLQLPLYLAENGRAVILTYHSLEDRMVKNFFRSGNFEGVVEKDFYGNPIMPFRLITRNPLIPGADEVKANKRARSAKLRIAEKI